jgi:energy-coupling factor transport system ATP-binding protein
MTLSDIPLEINHLSFKYQRREEPSLVDINFKVGPGQILLIAGSSGCGKTTLLRSINGLIPRIYQGEQKGEIRIFGKDVAELSMQELSQQVGTVLQDPERQIVSSHVFTEVAFGLENLAIPHIRIVSRVDDTLEYLGISDLRDRETFQLSGGEKQKVALAGVLAMQPKILLLDEPLASLDPASAAEALKLFRRLANDGISILLVEHRVEDVLAIKPEHVIYMDEGKIAYEGDTAGLLEVVDYTRIKLPAEIVMQRASNNNGVFLNDTPLPSPRKPVENRPLVRFDSVGFRYRPDLPAVLHHINFTVNKGDVIAILGPNGSGKTTLVKHALGLLKPTQGNVFLEEQNTKEISVAQAANTIGYVFQSPSQMLFAETVEDELKFGPQNLKHPADQIKHDVDWALKTVHMETELKSAPLALSFGQQKRISIAAVLAMSSRILMMDEPTAGQDYWNYMTFMDSILQMPGFDAIIFITHDLDLALIFANRILLLNSGTIAADGSPETVLEDTKILTKARVLPTSLLRLNQRLLPQTGHFLRAEVLSRYSQTIVTKGGLS